MEFILGGPVGAVENQRNADAADSAALRALFHDVANHMVTFSCLLEAIDADFGLSPAGRSHVSMMRAQTARMLALLKDSVDQGMRPTMVEVHGLVREVVSAADTRGPAAVTMDAAGERWLRTYPAALWRVVANIVDNAVRAAGTNGHVVVTVHDGQRIVRIDVVDDGPGFGKVRGGTASLGLEIAAGLTEKCCGNLTIVPVQPRGVRVSMNFPDLTPSTGNTVGTIKVSDGKPGDQP